MIDKVKEEFLLDFPAPYLGPLLGRQGVHLKNLCQKHGITNIYLGKKDDRGKRPYIYMSPFPVSYEYVAGDDKVGGFRKALNNWASLVKEKRDKHALAVSVGTSSWCMCLSLAYNRENSSTLKGGTWQYIGER